MKIKCIDGLDKEVEECLACGKCYPAPIMKTLLGGRNQKRTEREKPRFGVTRVIANCLRKSWFDLVEEVAHPLEKMWVFNRGHAIHDFFQKDMPKKDVEIFKEAKFALFDLIGFIDAVHDGVLYEFKTTATLPEIPQEHHVLQAQAYFSMLSPEEQDRVEKIIIIYFSLNGIKHFEVPKRIITHFLEANGTILAQALKANIPPQKEKSWLCNYCEFKEHCEKVDNGDYKAPEKEIAVSNNSTSENPLKKRSRKEGYPRAFPLLEKGEQKTLL